MRHHYASYSNLNAAWDQIPVQGLGAHRQHLMFDVSNLNAEWDSVPLQEFFGAGSLGGTSALGTALGLDPGCKISSVCEQALALNIPEIVGAASAYCDWPDHMRPSIDAQCQIALANRSGGASGGGGLSTGQAKELQAQINVKLKAAGYLPITVDGDLGPASCGAAKVVGITLPVSCAKSTPPTRASGGGGGGTVKTDVSPQVRSAGMGDTAWIIGGAAVAAGAIGLAIWAKKRKGG